MAAILFSKLVKIIIRLTFSANLMNLAAIFPVLEHLNNFEIIDYGSHFVFPNEAKILHRHVFLIVHILCKLGEDK